MSRSPRRGVGTDPTPQPCGSREAPRTHGLGKKTVLWPLGCWTDGWGRQTEVADVAADTKGPGIPALAQSDLPPSLPLSAQLV